ncbi:ribosomal-processing cysteine protease Prp [Peptoniphilus sp. SGI.035]|uniref:ribosomal-processing cysteine protease Prp n=1 Tax=unclassified Peptoniphilus TaxID=2637196 RepID=UPI0025E600DA|nr:ribosomal-processing cysteine protease Prp [Peptoniphilus sp.]MCI5643382.1 ribosomal-processing cysteine protease Prp [Peptoniphilus sp.]MDD7352079.1 ribosomal-processing cysteine protease Prp [Peptoniphilaceae bacterium]MDY3902675.1 ribosomal-processing cysteine protease Prp [Peptoniphilus sp.]
MTSIDLYKKGDYYYGFKSCGHAEGEFDKIVCSSISTLTQTFYFTLINKLGVSESEIVDIQGDGLLKIEILNSNVFKRKDIQTCFEFMIMGIELIDEAYPEYLTLKNVEV